MRKDKKQIITHRVITMLDRKEMDFLDKLGKDALFSTGHKLSYNEILKGLVDFAIEVGITGEKIDSLRALKGKIFELTGKNLQVKLGHKNKQVEEENKKGGENEANPS